MVLQDHSVGTFQTGDYVVFACLFVVSSGIGVFFAVKERKKASSREFLVGGRQMTCGPVALSLTASFMSAVTVIGAPSDVYRFGASYVIFGIAYTFVVILTAELFLPVFYRSGITSTYEYLELRFCKPVRIAATLIYMVQTILYTGVVVYAPALALNQVTKFNLWGSIIATGVVCTFYCTLGGLKAVVWSDAFQMVVMVVGFLTVLVQGSNSSGGIAAVWKTAQDGERLDIFKALYLNLLGLWLILFCAVVSGLIMYAFYAGCDPWTAGYVTAPDQLMPYFVLDILGRYPGLPGLFVACAFSGTLSTVAASINALATVTYEDFVRQCCGDISNRAATWISKALCVVFGVACTSMAVTASYMGAIVQAALSIHGMCGGPMLGVFSLGILFPFTNSKGAIGGLLLGITLAFWAAVGAFIYPASPNYTNPLSLSTENCTLLNSTAAAAAAAAVTQTPLLISTTASSDRSVLAESWYSMSYLYYSTVGFLATVIGGLLITVLTVPSKPQDVKPGLIRPVCDLFCFCSEKYRRLCWCGVNHAEEKMDLADLDFGTAWEIHPDQDKIIKTGRNGKKQSYDLQDEAYNNIAFVPDTTGQVMSGN
ncbi:sodium-coupled monocarboxylate transporter 2 isoform X2 [Astyanax mexicanus]|uniref:sodium-coupled monocarboxylate transporter 2 isoform X2 n=1 Tax=Astyanax mexicanus TaxID=7994 RepID=UPI0020CB5F1E|nr:sodium-coupled monocarboxylate transporter 2 isoform X2 [Astyanax mexicanus]